MLMLQEVRLLDPATRIDEIRDILISGGKVIKIGEALFLDATLIARAKGEKLRVIDGRGLCAAPGLVDVHVHLREPGFTYKEDILSGARAAMRGGFTTIIAMANTNPHIDTPKAVIDVLMKGRKTPIHIETCANITKGMLGKELVDMKALKEAGAIGFTDDGLPLMDIDLTKEAMKLAKALRLPLSFHEEDPAYIKQSGVNTGEVAKKLGLEGADRQAEYVMVLRDCKLAKETGATINIQHISAKESVDAVRKAKKLGVHVVAEATPHHFALTEESVLEFGTLAKMNPPLRTEADRQAIIEGLVDGTIDMIATDHAPHAKDEKDREFEKAPSGILGLETSLSLGITHLVDTGKMSMLSLIEKMTLAPARVYGLSRGIIKEEEMADIVIFDPEAIWTYDKTESKSTNSPWFGRELKGKVCYTICNGMVVYENN